MWDLVGNEAEVGFLRASITARRWSHAYLIEGPEFVGKYALASTLAKALNCLNKDKPCDVCSQCVRIQARKHDDVMEALSSSIKWSVKHKNKVVFISKFLPNYEAI